MVVAEMEETGVMVEMEETGVMVEMAAISLANYLRFLVDNLK
jgi:hypothetical protein